MTDAEIYFLWILRSMANPKCRKAIGVHVCFEEIERFARDPRDWGLLSSPTSESIGAIDRPSCPGRVPRRLPRERHAVPLSPVS
ncbi:hypothetical protein F4820DRAFT_441973 [Hypoxylon rubiginosum]|uniref:Uncharacterized protein n=1 Tax=Hypoxylon rubiginosum TaxID=110542 RepID=A0ACB9YGT3_9PEZI|nr:hypothetical protein F4820DRAFT_441973 [Hypoxylon rubiginosum]